MNQWITLLISIAVAAFVGGVTNHIAIKMLFHPRREWKWLGGRRVPFTPGLIPKRKEEIGGSLGRVVATHLVTAQGMAGMLTKPEFLEGVNRRLVLALEELASREETLAELALRWWPRESVDEAADKLAAWLAGKTEESIGLLWDKHGLSSLTIGRLLPDWDGSRKEELVGWGTELIVSSIRGELESPRGDMMIRQMTSQFMEQAGGFLGALAGMFMDADKTTGKVKAALLGQLHSPVLQRFLSDFIRDKLTWLENMTIEEAVRFAAKTDDPKMWVARQAASRIDWRAWLAEWGGRRLSELLGPRQERLAGHIPHAVQWAAGLVASRMDAIMEAIRLPEIVEAEVRRFPVERLEDIILSVSGKEFRAITWLGVLLGGLIGLFQALFLIWSR